MTVASGTALVIAIVLIGLWATSKGMEWWTAAQRPKRPPPGGWQRGGDSRKDGQ